MRLLFMGTAGFAVPSLKALKAAGHEISLVVCQPDRPKGRGQQLHAPELKVAAHELGLEVFQPEKIKEPSAVERLREQAADALCVVAYGQILPKAALDAPRLMALNVHASLLPKYRGAAPIEWALARGESETGVCVQKMAEKMDAGDVVMSQRLPLQASDDAESVTPRLAEMGAGLLLKSLAALKSGEIRLQPQDESLASFAPLLKKSHGIADFSLAGTELLNHFRGFKARPGFYSSLGGELLRIRRLALAEESGQPGRLLESNARGLRVGCASGSVWLEELQSPGGRPMPAADWARGRRPALGSAFEAPVVDAKAKGT
jgi:methionyl-tRNA formyltransferase